MKRTWVVLSMLCAAQAVAQSEGEHRGPHHGPPPKEALAACSGLAAGAACSFTIDEKVLSGTCRTGPRGETAACLPAGMHGPDGQR